MTNPDLIALANELDDIETDAGGKCNWSEVATVSSALRRLASSDGVVKGEPEPVAWRYRYNGKWYLSDTKAFAKAGLDVTPLYTAPPANAGMREALKLAHSTMESLRVALRDDPAVHDRKWIPHGIALNAAIRKADNALADAALTAPGATTKSDGGEPLSRTAGGFPVAAAPSQAEETGVIQSTRQGAGIERGMDQSVTGGESAATKPGRSDPSSTRSEVTVDELTAALDRLVNAKALKGVRSLVAGWNGEDRDEPYKERHPSRLGATLPKTNCGTVYELDEAMQMGRALLSRYEMRRR